jgi:hypothetical protein
MSTKDTLFQELTDLEEKFSGLLVALSECKTKMLVGFAVGHVVYTADKLTTEEKKQIAALEKSRKALAAAGIDGVALSGIDKQIKAIKGDKSEKAWRAYRAHMSPTNGTSTGKGTLPDNCVVRVHFGEHGTHFVVRKGKSASLYKIDGTKAVLVTLRATLKGYAEKKVTSPTAARRLAYAQLNSTDTSTCSDGVGVKAEGYVGGKLAHVVSENPADWLKNPAHMPLWVQETETETEKNE